MEDAVDFHQLHDAVGIVADLADDLDHGLLHITLVGLHLHFAQRKIFQVAAGFGGEHRARLACCVAAQQPPRAAAHRQRHNGDRHKQRLIIFICRQLSSLEYTE